MHNIKKKLLYSQKNVRKRVSVAAFARVQTLATVLRHIPFQAPRDAKLSGSNHVPSREIRLPSCPASSSLQKPGFPTTFLNTNSGYYMYRFL
jgi:hypothetical protein